MKVKELIKELEKYNKDAEIVLWKWTGNGSRYQYLNFPCNQNLNNLFILTQSEFAWMKLTDRHELVEADD